MLETGPIRHDIAACLAGRVGPAGLAEARFAALLDAAKPALATLRRWHAERTLPLLALPHRTDDLDALAPVAARLASARDLVVVGIGGSSLGGATLYRLADRGHGNRLGGPKVHFLDNIDPASFEALTDVLDPASTALLLVSKSGGTAETLLTALALLDRMPGDLSGRAVAISEAGDSPLRRLAASRDIPVLDHDPNIDGRYSGLSLVALLPAMAGGLDVRAVRRGAAAVLDATLAAATPADSAPTVGAVLSVGLRRDNGVSQSVLMPYLDGLDRLAKWYRQLWAESLGKDGNGTTPVDALGAVDQHSQLQLYLDGPRDKLFTLVLADMAGRGPRVADCATTAAGPSVGYLAGRTMGDLMDAEQRATVATLIRNGCPTRIMRIGRLDEESLGALMMHFFLETILTALVLGIDPFGQPAVEQGKVLARQYLAEMAR